MLDCLTLPPPRPLLPEERFTELRLAPELLPEVRRWASATWAVKPKAMSSTVRLVPCTRIEEKRPISDFIV